MLHGESQRSAFVTPCMAVTSLPKPLGRDDARSFLDKVGARGFPCVGAKSAAARGRLELVRAQDITSGWNDLEIHRALIEWSRDYDPSDPDLRSFVVVFDGPGDLSEAQFERALWSRLQSLTDKDEWLGQRRDPEVVADPDNPHFAVSYGGRAYFIVGLHSGASRPARRFERPAIVFNLHDQFERLREAGRYDKMRDTIIARDIAYAGSKNPMLSDHGEASAARQYSGRAVADDWRCPFSDPRA